jgi:hypothetical protein
VFFNYPFNQEHVQTFIAYREAGAYRRTAASLTAKKGGKFAISSLSSAFDDVPHTGNMRYEEDISKVPAVTIGNTTADELETL